MEHVLLSMQHISKSYPGVQALDDVSLRLAARSWRWPEKTAQENQRL